MNLQIEVTFTTGHFHGDEWPPSPARLYQALVAASYHGAHGLINATVRDTALKWFEKQKPPIIYAPNVVHKLDHLTNFVPNNDDEVGENVHVRAAKSMSAHFLHITKVVTYEWPIAQNDVQQADVISAMASLVTYLGRTVDTVYARGQILEKTSIFKGCVVWQPKEQCGGKWLAPNEGFLDLLNRRYPCSVSIEPPAPLTNSRQIHYASESLIEDRVPVAVFEMLRLDGERKLAFAPRDMRQPAGMTRNSMLQWIKASPEIQSNFTPDQLARLLLGHQSAAASKPSQGGHFAVVPLPSINPPDYTADGWIRKVAIIGYGIQSSSDTELFNELMRGLHGAILEDNNKSRGELRLLTSSQKNRVLRFFIGPAKYWRSISPVVLTGFTRRGRSTEKCLLRSLSQQGYLSDNIESVATYAGPIVPTADVAKNYRIQGYLQTTPRIHAEIIFRSPIQGPLVIGRGRFAGLGLFVPVEESEEKMT